MRRGVTESEKRSGGERGELGRAWQGGESSGGRGGSEGSWVLPSVDPSDSRAAIGDGERNEQIVSDPIEECEFFKKHPAEFRMRALRGRFGSALFDLGDPYAHTALLHDRPPLALGVENLGSEGEPSPELFMDFTCEGVQGLLTFVDLATGQFESPSELRRVGACGTQQVARIGQGIDYRGGNDWSGSHALSLGV